MIVLPHYGYGSWAARAAYNGNGFQDERYFDRVVSFCERAESELTPG